MEDWVDWHSSTVIRDLGVGSCQGSCLLFLEKALCSQSCSLNPWVYIRKIVRYAGKLVGRCIDRLVGRLIDRPVGRLVDGETARFTFSEMEG